MNDLKRVLTPGPAIVCNGHILYSGISCAISVWLAKRVLDDGAQYLKYGCMSHSNITMYNTGRKDKCICKLRHCPSCWICRWTRSDSSVFI
eukprot:Seg1346.1 transcript_id=Seg1346.1/GoldUCD/mRNA.D3Y31 product="hypothetical protein" protein_id=Seg1346.1/GoldUCD/D3Y31